MSATPVLSALYRYPVKSMRGESLAASPVGPAGLPYDRTWMVADENGRFVTGRTHPELVLVAARPGPGGVTLSAPGRDDLFVPDDLAPSLVQRAVATGGRVVSEANAPFELTVADPEGNELGIAG